MGTYITAVCVLVLRVRLWRVKKGEERGCAAAAFKEGDVLYL